MKPIKMSKEHADKWLTALRSGDYKQGKGSLQDQHGGYCCLGVLQMVCDNTVEKLKNSGEGYRSCGLPTTQWLVDHNINFINIAGTITNNPPIMIDGQQCFLSVMNDGMGLNFKQIADIIETNMETF
jgi:hypothetical protein